MANGVKVIVPVYQSPNLRSSDVKVFSLTEVGLSKIATGVAARELKEGIDLILERIDPWRPTPNIFFDGKTYNKRTYAVWTWV